MPIDVYMTQLSPTMTEGKIVRWLKKEGDELTSGEVMAEIETDKATMEMEVVDEGVLHRILQPEGAVVTVGSPIAVIAEEDEEIPDDYMPEGIDETTPAQETVSPEAEAPVVTPEQVVETITASTPVVANEAGEEHELSLKLSGVFNANGEYDVVIIGAGPGGYVAAIRATQLGLKTACIEAKHLGGICLNWGCIPTKALLRTAEIINVITHNGKELGIGLTTPKPDLVQAVARSRGISEKLAGGIGFLFKKNKVEHIEGYARFAPDNKLIVEGKDGEREVTAKHVIVATGARARAFPGM
ncbi:MAG: FAD-dependent oxidoreductase, partial [Mariprofundaceae bacterium]|nr:FAD-dependent oxidoreductase [Mariprofundaceae bacterium]